MKITNCFMFLFYFQQVSHPNIVSLVEEFHTSQHLYLVMELVRVIVFLRLKSYISKKKFLKLKKICVYMSSLIFFHYVLGWRPV